MARQIILISAFFAVFAALCLLPGAVSAQDHGKKLQAIFEELLDQYRETAGASGATLVTEGKILVEKSGPYYAVTLPHITVKQASGDYTEIGMIAINALPGDTPEQWKMTVAMPTPVIHYNADSKPSLTAEIGGQNFAGVWDEKVKNFVKINALYSNLNLTSHKERVRIIIPGIKMFYDLDKNADGMWSGPGDFTISDFQMYFDEDGAAARIGEISIITEMEDYSPEAALAYQEQVNALVESYEAGEMDKISGQHVMGVYNMIADAMGNSWNAFDTTVKIKDMSLTRPPIPGSPPGLLKITGAAFGFGMKGFRSGKVGANMRLAYDGFELAPLAENYKKAVPGHFGIDISINNLPWKDLMELGRTTLQSATAVPETGPMMAMMAIPGAAQHLTQAQTNMKLNSAAAGNAHYGIKANGMITANLNAALGMTGNAHMEVFGLDNLIASLNEVVNDPETPDTKKAKIRNTLAGIAVVKMAGQMAKDDKGRDIRTYDFILDEQGQPLLNGTDLQMLMQTMEGGGQSP